MAVNEKHPDFPEYIKKCEKLREQMIAEIEKVPKRQRPTLDNGDISKIHHKYNKKLKELQAEYKHLFQ